MKKNAMNGSALKRWAGMTTEELAAATKSFDDPAYVPKPAKMPEELRARHAKALVGLRGGKRVNSSKRRAARVQITLEPQLLRGADAMAQREGISRSELFARGLKLLMT